MLTTIIRLSPSPRTLLFAGVTSVAVPTLVYRRFISSSTVMPSLKDVKAENARYAPGYLPVAVFVGGTSGIGQGMAQAFAKHTNGNAHIVLVGRNEAAASAILASFPTPTSPHAKHEFIQSDISLMANVRATATQLLASLPKINYLVLSTGVMTLDGRTETSEGIDKKLAVHYYARFKLTHELLPLLKKAEEEGEDAKAYSVFSPGYGGPIDVKDLGLKKTYSVRNAALQGVSYMDAAYKEFAARHPSSRLTFTHAHPGGVDSGLLTNSTSRPVRILQTCLGPIIRAAAPLIGIVSVEDAGEYQLYGMLQQTGGLQRVGARGQDIGMEAFYGGDEVVRRKVWQHSVRECRVEESKLA